MAGQIGNNSAAIVTAQMRHTFGSIRFGLMAGIEGGVLTKKDIRLGDVVVSQPGKHGGTVRLRKNLYKADDSYTLVH